MNLQIIQLQRQQILREIVPAIVSLNFIIGIKQHF